MEDAREDLKRTIADLKHQALRNALYHAARSNWLDGRNRMFSLFVILAGTATVTNVMGNHDARDLLLGGAIVLVGALQLVCDFTGRARRHDRLQNRYAGLMKTIESHPDATRRECDEWASEIIHAAADEPPAMRALYAIADNQATAALTGLTRPRLMVSPWRSLTRQILPHNASVFAVDPGWDR